MRVSVRVSALAAATGGALAALASIANAQASSASTAHPAPATSRAASPASGAVDMLHAKASFQAMCSKCHDPGIATSQNHDRTGWQEVIQRMYGFGLVASEEETKEVVEYLAATYPPAEQ